MSIWLSGRSSRRYLLTLALGPLLLPAGMRYGAGVMPRSKEDQHSPKSTRFFMTDRLFMTRTGLSNLAAAVRTTKNSMGQVGPVRWFQTMFTTCAASSV